MAGAVAASSVSMVLMAGGARVRSVRAANHLERKERCFRGAAIGSQRPHAVLLHAYEMDACEEVCVSYKIRICFV